MISPLKRIVVPLDGSDSSFRAAKYAIKVAKMANAEICFVYEAKKRETTKIRMRHVRRKIH
jgi:nucleotide-binding universal stress UspA family protein